MANPLLKSSTNPHFFQPLLPGFHAHLKIPVAFFSSYMKGGTEQKTAKLRSKTSDKTWIVKMEGRRLTEGWKEFATAHDLRIGDIIIFSKHEEMVLNVTPFGPSCCEIEYSNANIKKEEDYAVNDDEHDNIQNQHNISLSKKSSLSFEYCFIASVSASNLRLDSLHLPKQAVSSKALNKRCEKIIVVNQEGDSWTLNLRFREREGRYYMRGGWRKFCYENKQKKGDLITFNLVGDGKSTPMLCICREEDCFELINKERVNKKTEKRRKWVGSSSSRQNRFVTIVLTAYNIKNSKLSLPVSFTKANGFNNQQKSIILLDKYGVKRLINLVHDGSNRGRRGLGKGWKLFCEANDIKIGDSFKLELIWEDSIPVLRFCSKVKEEIICV